MASNCAKRRGIHFRTAPKCDRNNLNALTIQVPDEKDPPQFMILVQVDEDVAVRNSKMAVENISSGWVVLRSCTEFNVSCHSNDFDVVIVKTALFICL